MSRDLFPRLKRRGWSLENRSALLLIPPTVAAAIATYFIVQAILPDVTEKVPFVAALGVAGIGAAVQRRYLRDRR